MTLPIFFLLLTPGAVASVSCPAPVVVHEATIRAELEEGLDRARPELLAEGIAPPATIPFSQGGVLAGREAELHVAHSGSSETTHLDAPLRFVVPCGAPPETLRELDHQVGHLLCQRFAVQGKECENSWHEGKDLFGR